MSIKITSVVWTSYQGGGSELLVLLALSEWANDDGRCYPGISAIATKTRLSRSQVQRVVHRLVNEGVVSVTGNHSGGPPGATRRYQIELEKLTGSAAATGSVGAQEGPHPCGETGSTHATQTVIEPSLTVKEERDNPLPSKNLPTVAHKRGASERCPQDVSGTVWQDFLAMRKAKKAPVTDTAIAGIRREAEKAGLTMQGAITACCENNWQGFKAAWYAERTAKAGTPGRFGAPAEAAWRTEQRERTRLAAPGVAAQPQTAHAFFTETEAIDVVAHRLY